ncbi:putative alpha beta hydrolase family protein [Diplogelasinospora grovesii]|uniref:Alpha beta hydrolase family protein n=1 Tax=Diplogelasinospora grovesii TaxID=303347 RepID=A0AAN6NBL8_9PEZI|nr:putative alpha beta hydrolase family protein [Diplogelasinospora grovesii]
MGKPVIISGPLATAKSKEELLKLEYKPDHFEGARDISTPYGSTRVYEWGPEAGNKVLFIHGVTTSCMTLGIIAKALVERGFRVMLFDLYGRGYSDGVKGVKHDARLYVDQTLAVLKSSPLGNWDQGFRLIGYSMGGSIAVHFAAEHPEMLSSPLTLLCPAGLIRASYMFDLKSRIAFQTGLIPARYIHSKLKDRLRKPMHESVKNKADMDAAAAATAAAADTAMTELGDEPPAPEEPREAQELYERQRKHIEWMIDNHGGFIPAVADCFKHAPFTKQQPAWTKMAAKLKEKNKTLVIILGAKDDLINLGHFKADAVPILDKAGVNYRLRVINDANHNFPMTHSQKVLALIYQAWGIQPLLPPPPPSSAQKK